jgi:hypothetical protein
VLSELYQSQVVDNNPVLFDPPGLYHVGQPECPEGNCYQHHLEMGEIPCTSKIVCDLREEFRTNTARINRSDCKKQERVKEKEKERSDRWDRELEQFQKWQLKWGFNYRE